MKDVAKPAAEFFKKKGTVKAGDLRKSLLRRLERKSKEIARAWRVYEKKKVKKK